MFFKLCFCFYCYIFCLKVLGTYRFHFREEAFQDLFTPKHEESADSDAPGLSKRLPM